MKLLRIPTGASLLSRIIMYLPVLIFTMVPR
ncbi:hypothetical protein vBEcoMWL3_gp262 [Escherichia phage vB_EcoM_WL-3]|nr:hypothetical protein vBEcoMWL3_gp262 [Escherichia phage vB_EcoM_WL-3]